MSKKVVSMKYIKFDLLPLQNTTLDQFVKVRNKINHVSKND
jgi:hypothetical protein